jgi:predicted transcriptional regulator of viral defense system
MLLQRRLYFTSQDVADVLGIKPSSATVLCARYVKKGLFIRLKKDFYVMKERWQRNSPSEFFQIANILQVPSYVSLMTALSFYEVTTQIRRKFFESVCIKRTAKYEIDGSLFNFYKLKRELYFDFIKQGDFFIATKEKALLDAIILILFWKILF